MHLEFASALNPSQNLTEIAARRHLMNDWGFRVVKAICQNPDVLVCKLIEGKITYVHRRLWPALIKLAFRFRKEQLAKVWDEHTRGGAHQSRREHFPNWLPSEVMKEAEALSIAEAKNILSPWRLWMPNKFPHRRDGRSRAMRD